MAYTREDYADGQVQRRSGIKRLMFERKMFPVGSWRADFHPDLQPAVGATLLLPHQGDTEVLTMIDDHRSLSLRVQL